MLFPEALGHPVFSVLSDIASEHNLNAYVIGGYVRDFFLKRPSKDVDIVVEGEGTRLAQLFADKTNAKSLAVYENFRTAMVRFEDFEVEFVGARKESYRRDSRKPIVEEGSLNDDQLRRDFTINALSLSLRKEEFGKMYDPFDGFSDLEKEIIRTPTDPDKTFSDDPLRMMRGIRFATQLNFRIYPETYESIAENRERISIISQERITDELNKIMLSPIPSKGFKMLLGTGLLELIFPELMKLKGVEYRQGRGHKDNFFHTLQVLDNVAERSDNLWLRWAALLHDIAKPQTKRFDTVAGWTFHGHEDLGARMVPKIFRRLRLPLDYKMKYVQNLVKLHLRPIALVKEEVTDSAIRRLIVEAGEDLNDLMILCRCDITSKNEARVERYLHNFDKVEEKVKEVEERDQLRNWQPPVTGEMIMEAFNLRPSKEVGEIKSAVREAILEGEIPNDRAEAIRYMYKIGKEFLGREPENEID